MRRLFPIPALAAAACGLLLAIPLAAQEADQPDWFAEPPAMRPGAPRELLGPTILDRLENMKPEQRRRLLDNLPPERRRRLEQRLAAYEALPPAERERLRRQYDTFRAMTPQQKQAARRLFRRFMELPPGRRQVLRQEGLRLGRMPWRQRQARISAPEFQNRYTPEERQILRAIAAITPNP